MKKFLALVLSLVMALSLAACGGDSDDTQKEDGEGDEAAPVKVGMICLPRNT